MALLTPHMNKSNIDLPIERVESVVLVIRGEKVILDADLARLYGVTTSRLNEQVGRNRERFPEDFVFQLTGEESATLRSQNAISKSRGGRRYLPFAFTEHGAINGSQCVLNSQRAVQASVQVVRAFVKLRRILASHTELAKKLAELEGKYDSQFKIVFEAIRKLMAPPVVKRKEIGFRPKALKR